MSGKFRQFLTILFSMLLLFGKPVIAQTEKPFSEEPVAFMLELQGFMKQATDKETKGAMQEFSSRWSSGNYTPEVQNSIMAAVNVMKMQRMKPTPAFRDYLFALNSFSKDVSPKSLKDWHKGLTPFLDGKNLRTLSSFLDNTTDLNTRQILSLSHAILWKYRGGKHTYYYDTTLKVGLDKVDLVCISGRDSIRILETSGTHYPLKDRFSGFGGRVTWEASGYDPQSVYATPGNFTINLKQTGWTADTANFYHKDFFDHATPGKFEDRVTAGISAERATFPKFTSWQKDVEIQQIFPHIHYRGGFTLEGSRIIGSGQDDQDAILWVSYKGQPTLKLASRDFVFRQDRLSSQRASATWYHEGDSIFHPGVQLRYNNENRELILKQSTDGSTASPFYNSYHNLDMYFETLVFILESDSLSFEMQKGTRQQAEAIFESSNFFADERYYRMQGIDEINPINVIYNYVNKNKGLRIFYVNELAEYMKKPVTQVKAMALNLANSGYIIYNIDNERMEVTDRLFDFLNAKSKKKDYDVIQIVSRVTGTNNASLNLKTFDLTIKGVPELSVSDSQAVFIYPRNHEILVQKGLDFVFTGKVKAGSFDFYSNESSFEYGKFQLSMPQIDSISFKVDTVNKKTKKAGQVKVKNILANLSGDLLIDAPDNKSGIKDLPEYPVFIIKNDGYVYFDSPNIEKGTYNRDEFYYVVEPSQRVTLSSSATDGLKFKGYLYSEGILPEIHEPIKVMKDYSLGFEQTLENKGIPLYDGKAMFHGSLLLSNKGLEGAGNMKYLSSTSESKRFLFTPDSLTANLEQFSMTEVSGIPAYPQLQAEGVHQFWLPNQDTMLLTSFPGKHFVMYNQKSLHTGSLLLTSTGMLGEGKSKLDYADIESDTFVFSNQSFNTDTTSLQLYYPERPNLLLSVNIHPGTVDFKNNIANFGTPGESLKIDLPLSRYYTFMDKIEWRMKDEELVFTNSLARRAELSDTARLADLVDFDFSGSEFVSTNPALDSLQFFAMEATFHMKENTINAREVKIIRAGDAAIFPGDGQVTLLADGAMKPLENATLIASRKNKAFTIYNADVHVKSRKDYLASGYYDYSDEDGNVQPIYFGKLTVDSSGNTNGKAKIPKESPLALSSHFNFIGDINLNVSNPFLTYDGNYRPVSECFDEDGPWVSFNAQLDPKDIKLPVSPIMRDSLGDPVMTAIVYSNFFNSVYPAMFRKPKAFGDTLVASTAGIIKYNEKTESFLMGTENRLNNSSAEGNLTSINTRQCIISSVGEIQTGARLGQFKLRSFGKVRHFSIADSTRFDLAIALDFFFSEAALQKLRESLQKSELKGTEVNSEAYRYLFTGLVGTQQAGVLLNELNTTGQIKRPPPEIIQSITLSNIEMTWNENLKSFVSEGQFGIAGILSDPVNRMVNGYLEIGKRRTGDILNLYIEVSKTEWFFFSYGNGIMQAISSDNEFNSILAKLRADKRSLKSHGSSSEAYQYIISTPDRRIAFLRKMQSRGSDD